MCVRCEQVIRRLGYFLIRNGIIEFQSAESAREPGDDGENLRNTTLIGLTSKDTKFQFCCLRTRAWVRRASDGTFSWRWELSAFAFNDVKALKIVTSQRDMGNVVGNERTTFELDCLECGEVGVDEFPDAKPLIGKLSSNDSKTF